MNVWYLQFTDLIAQALWNRICTFFILDVSASPSIDDKTGKIEDLDLNSRIKEAKATAGGLEAYYFTRLPKYPTKTPFQEAEITISTVAYNEMKGILIKDRNLSSLRLQTDHVENSTGESHNKNHDKITTGTCLCLMRTVEN